MKKRQILWAIVFGSMLAITGCGDDPESLDQALGTGGTGGGDASSFCATLCESCGGGASAQCASECEASFDQAGSGIDFDSCPSELNALGNCLGANNCNNDQCGPQFTAYIICVAGIAF